jgi:hypothetical protein
MSGPFDWYNRSFSDTFSTFRNCAYGAKVPVRVLDPGIALLVKVLPAIGARTVYSCDGHVEEPPSVRFFSRYDLSWVQMVFASLFEGDHVQETWHFNEEGEGWMRFVWRWGNGGPGMFLDARYSLFADIQRVARVMFDSDLVAEIRRVRQRIARPGGWMARAQDGLRRLAAVR